MKKNNPTGVRFNEDKLAFVMEREKLTSPQQVVNFLLDAYWWKNKVNTGQSEELAPTNTETVTGAPKSKIKRSYDWYVSAITDLQFEAEYRNMSDLIRADEALTTKQKETLLLAMKTNQS